MGVRRAEGVAGEGEGPDGVIGGGGGAGGC